jgi:hypothetical protein
MTCESLKRGRGEVKSCFPFFLFQISFIYFYFFILSNAKVSKRNMQWKRRKENGRFGSEREYSIANGGRRVEKKMG